MLAKQYLKDNGFTSHRGKRTADEITALNNAIETYGDIFSDYKYRKPKAQSVMKAPSITKNVAYRRKENVLAIVDSEGTRIALDHHPACGQSIRRCQCGEITPPSWISAESWSLELR